MKYSTSLMEIQCSKGNGDNDIQKRITLRLCKLVIFHSKKPTYELLKCIYYTHVEIYVLASSKVFYGGA